VVSPDIFLPVNSGITLRSTTYAVSTWLIPRNFTDTTCFIISMNLISKDKEKINTLDYFLFVVRIFGMLEELPKKHLLFFF
jgi:hypothetical protein